MGYSKPLNSDDWKLIRSAADDGTTTKDFAAEMNLSEDDVWTYLNSKSGEFYRDRFIENNKRAAQ